MAKQTPETLAADLARRGGPKRPSMEERAAAARRVQANPRKPMMYNDQAMIARGAKPARSTPPVGPVERPATAITWRPPQAGGPAYSGPGPQPPIRGPAFDVSFTPPPRPISTYQAPPVSRPLTPTTAPGGLPGSAMPQQSDWAPPMQMGMDAGAWRPPMSNPPPAPRPQAMQTMTQLINILSKLSDWGGDDGRATTDARTWLPDLWSLSGR